MAITPQNPVNNIYDQFNWLDDFEDWQANLRAGVVLFKGIQLDKDELAVLRNSAHSFNESKIWSFIKNEVRKRAVATLVKETGGQKAAGMLLALEAIQETLNNLGQGV